MCRDHRQTIGDPGGFSFFYKIESVHISIIFFERIFFRNELAVFMDPLTV